MARRKKRRDSGRKLLVVDTNVLIDYPACFWWFRENDLYIPQQVIRELIHHRQKNSCYNAHRAYRALDNLSKIKKQRVFQHETYASVPLNQYAYQDRGGRLYYSYEQRVSRPSFDDPDGLIIAEALDLKPRYPDHTIVLITKDVSMRRRARYLGLRASHPGYFF